MIKSLLAAAAVAALCASPIAHAQSDTPGDGRAATTKPATKSEKEAAKQSRKSAGKEVVKKDEGRLDDTSGSAGKAKSATAQEKSAAKSKRKTEGSAAAKSGSTGGEAKQ
jgi:hypothetical protein